MRHFSLIFSFLFILTACETGLEQNASSDQNRDLSFIESEKELEIEIEDSSIENFQAIESVVEWTEMKLPNWDIVSFEYPSDWLLKASDDQNLTLSKEDETIHIFYNADPRLINPKSEEKIDYEGLMEEYLNLYGQDFFEMEPVDVGHSWKGIVFLVSLGSDVELHHVFFVGTVQIDVYSSTASQMDIYDKVLESFSYGGY